MTLVRPHLCQRSLSLQQSIWDIVDEPVSLSQVGTHWMAQVIVGSNVSKHRYQTCGYMATLCLWGGETGCSAATLADTAVQKLCLLSALIAEIEGYAAHFNSERRCILVHRASSWGEESVVQIKHFLPKVTPPFFLERKYTTGTVQCQYFIYCILH